MRRRDNEPLLFDLPLGRPARDDEDEPLLDRQPPRPPETAAPPPRLPAAAPPVAGRGTPGSSRLPAAPAAGASAGAPAGPPAGAAAATAAGQRRIPARAEGLHAEEDARPASRLPIASAAGIAAGAAAPAAEPARGRPLPAAAATAPGGPAEREQRGVAPDAAVGGAVEAGAPAAKAGVGRRLAAAAADLLFHAAVTVTALGGCLYLGVVPALADWPALAVFVLSFSFLYTVVPLAFWGHTLGMTWAGLTAESLDGEPLSFDQTARRWLGALLTLATLGLPLLLALGGRSLADRLSGSRTLAG